MIGTRLLIAVLLATSLLGTASAQPLAAGKPSGVREAQINRQAVAVTGTAIALIAGFALLVSQQDDTSAAAIITGGGNAIVVTGTNSTMTSSR